MRAFRLMASACLLLAAACADDDPTLGTEHFLRAEVRGSVVSRYRGGGEWFFGGNGVEYPHYLAASSADAGPAHHLGLLRHGPREVPAPGLYPIAAPDPSRGAWDHFALTYLRRRGEVMDVYASVSGRMELTRADDDELGGRFRFTGRRVCVLDPADPSPPACDPTRVAPDAPTIQVIGEFLLPRSRQAGGAPPPWLR